MCVGLFVFLISSLFITSAFCGIYNGNFEVFDHNETCDINTPSNWFCDANYISCVGSLEPASATWKIDTPLLPFKGSYFLLLSTGDHRMCQASSGAKVWQFLDVEAGNTLKGVFFFGTVDWNPFPDWGTITVKLLDNPDEPIEIVYVQVEDVGSYGSGDTGSMSGWKSFEYTFETAGTYELDIMVCDYSDTAYDTFFAVDNLVLCSSNAAAMGDFNGDCSVNFADFAYFASDWLFNCEDPEVHNDPESDPDYYNAPYSFCLLGTDMNDDGPVDVNDLKIMAENWLLGVEE